MSGKKVTIPAVHDLDLKDVLAKLNLLDKIEAGEILCAQCQNTITIKNLGGLAKKNDRLLLFCSQTDCLDTCVEE